MWWDPAACALLLLFRPVPSCWFLLVSFVVRVCSAARALRLARPATLLSLPYSLRYAQHDPHAPSHLLIAAIAVIVLIPRRPARQAGTVGIVPTTAPPAANATTHTTTTIAKHGGATAPCAAHDVGGVQVQ